jgi:hypothetical protein
METSDVCDLTARSSATEAAKHLPDQAHLQAMFGSVPRQSAMPAARELEMIKQPFESPAVRAMQAVFKKKD